MFIRQSSRLPSQLARQAASRQFSTRAALRQEIRDAYIISASRTPTAKAKTNGSFNGSFTSVTAPQLGAVAIKSAIEKSKVPVDKITDVYMGNVLQGSVGQAPARQALIFAGLPSSVEAITINKVCASGMKAVVFAAQNIQLGLSEAQVAGGMENMTRVPYYVPRASSLPPFGHVQMEDGLIKDGLTDVYDKFHMGNCAENTAKKYDISREMQDEYAIESYKRAQAAWKANAFAEEIAPVTVRGRKGDTVIESDEGYLDVKFDRVPTLKPAFVRDGTGTVTAANSSTLNDGASALVLGSKEIAQKYGSDSRVLAKICGSADAAVDPIDFPIAPAKAVPIALERAGITKDQVAVWEFNEAFAAVIKANEKILGLEGARVNPLGGAISLGHALGSSGSRIIVTLLHQLKPGEYGVAAICNGGGAATAIVVQRVESVQIRTFVRAQNIDELRNWLLVEPNANQQYHALANELRTQFRSSRHGSNGTSSTALESTIEKCLPEEDDVPEGQGSPWPGFVTFMKDYMVFWRDVDYDDLLGAHTLLSGLVNSCSTAFAHPTYGGMLLKAALSLCESLSRLTMMLSKRPDLTRNIRNVDADDRKSIAESSAEIIQKIFTTCLTDRSSARYSKPEGKKVGVYMFANLVLKLLFACRRTHLAKQIFTNISTNSPPLSFYPASQRVNFLYYLGRFNLANCHFLRAALCLEEAYLQIPPPLISHRALVLSYLVPCNFLLGRLPSQLLLSRPEASALVPVYQPLIQAIRKGDFVLFQQTLAQHEKYLFDKGLLLVLTHRLRPLLWRSLSRRTFLLTYAPGQDDANPSNTNRRAATMDLADLHATSQYLQHRLEGYIPSKSPSSFAPSTASPAFLKAVSHDAASTLVPPPGGPKKLRPNEGLVWGNSPVEMDDVEMNVSVLIQLGFMHGFIAHSQGRFAVMGATKKSPVLAGWPTPWTAIRERQYEEDLDLDHVPGWVKG
ncbi:PCI domain-containing protein [Colletotrichum tamarilloi]|uniref:acetyl-CoA C-acetyltransferase n=1 Tax=Colletotrichum tamarilloi TaxID=1209934 RepID=A0ABQ9RL89_9PEZI|nr:PCI domain-containing protein [Colletotrichum tamarilloi]KAK1506835.1 PCI domain-containing protein [Colletotrichum tamarilloi]